MRDEQSRAGCRDDLIVSDVIRTNELQIWFLAEHVVDTPAVRTE